MDFSKEEPNLPSDSDDSDEDYQPSGAESNPPSEVESDGEDENNPESDDEETPNTKKRKRVQKNKKRKSRKKDGLTASDTEETEENVNCSDENIKVLTEEEEKKHADSLWADFMNDPKVVKTSSKISASNKREESSIKTNKEKVELKKTEKENKVTITEIFNFAGEEVKVTKEVDSSSKEILATQSPLKVHGPGSSTPSIGSRGRGGGLSAVLGQLGKKQKLGTLEKSKLDWDSFKKAQGIDDELRTFNRGKDGYLEKQDFLQRTDLRQFEIEKGLRSTRKSNR